MSIKNRILATIVVTPLLAGLLVGCAAGGDNGGSGAGPTGSAEQSFEDWELDFAACMRKAGIEYPDPGEEGALVALSEEDSDAFWAAAEACIDELGEAPVNPNAPTEQETEAEILAMVECFRDHGFEMADPQPGEAIGLPEEVTEEVLEECGLTGAPAGSSGN